MRHTAKGPIIAISFFFIIAPLMTTFAQEAAGAPTIDYFEGWVTADGEPVDFGQPLSPGTLVQVGEGSYCEIIFGGNILRIQENSIATIEIDSRKRKLDLRFGGVAAVFKKLQTLGGRESFEFRTPTAVGGVRGTTFYIRVEDVSNTYICTCNGELGLEFPNMHDERQILSAHHTAYRFTRGEGGSISAASAGLIYHTDEEMEELASNVDIEIDWSRAE